MQPKPFVRPPIVERLDTESVEPGRVQRFRVVMTENATGNETLVPVVVLRGATAGPVVGVTAAIHGNELNGILVVHRLMEHIEKTGLIKGAVVAVPIVNIPGYLRMQREFEDGCDLNRIMPGSATGDESELYAHRFVERVLSRFNYLLDLHTASTGRANSLYVRANMRDPTTAQLARLIAPQIIVHSEDHDGTLRGTAVDLGIKALTLEVGDPQRFQRGLIRSARIGLQEMLNHLGLIDNDGDPEEREVVECSRSYWTYTDRGGVLSVISEVSETVKAGQVVARLHNVWGDMVREYEAPEDGIIVGRSTNPAARAGSRIIHLGVPARGV